MGTYRSYDLSVERIKADILRSRRDPERYTYIILGQPGPTGKTSLCRTLREHGLNAFEISKDVIWAVDYADDRNHYITNDSDMCVTIVLNRRVK